MRKILLSSVMALALSGVMSAAAVTYTTSGSVFTATGTNSIDFGDLGTDGLHVEFTGLTDESGSTDFTDNLGTFNVVIYGAGFAGSADFELHIDQTVPVAGNSVINGTFTQNFNGIDGTGTLVFTTGTTMIDTIKYTFNNPVFINNPGGENSNTTIQALIQDTGAETPEPATMGLMGAALLGFAGLLRRRKA